MHTLDRDLVVALRERRYRRMPERAVSTVEEARAFVDEVGFCYLWPIKDVELPNLFHAIAGRVRSVPNAHHDPDLSRCWGWKDGALGKRWWYYGKVLRHKATLISMRLLPYFYACSENYGALEDYIQEYEAGTMTVEAKQIYEALLKLGPLDTVRLQREAHMRGAKGRFERSLVELQAGFKILPVGVADAGAWHYAFVYDLVPRHLPDLPEQARPISRRDARQALVRQYIENVVAAGRGMVSRVFHVLHWTPTELDHTLRALLEEGTLCEVRIEGEAQPQFVPAAVIDV